MPSPTSGGRPPRLAVISHKGGTGRTTLALGLAWVLGQQGQRVLLADPDPTGSALLTACDAAGVCRWKNVRAVAGLPAHDDDADLIIIDAPALNERAALPVLIAADWLLLTCLADTLALRTLPAAAIALREAKGQGGRAALLGIVMNQYDESDPIQKRLLTQMTLSKRPPVLEPAIPVQPTLRDWAMKPGSAMPAGAARAAVLELAFSLRERLAGRVEETEAVHA